MINKLPLAKKYRPNKFHDVIGQDSIKLILMNSINDASGDNIASILLYGERGSGKTSLARIYASALNCANYNGDVCGICESCISTKECSHVDVIEIDAASKNSVDGIRDLIENAKYLPQASKYKIYILDEVHMLSNAAFNALLKILEEPPIYVKFLLITTEYSKIPLTIISRCIRLNFKKLTHDCINRQLETICSIESILYDSNSLNKITKYSEGSMRDALSLLDQVSILTNKNVSEKDLEGIIGYVALDSDIHHLLLSILSNNKEDSLMYANKLIDISPHIDNLLVSILDILSEIITSYLIGGSLTLSNVFSGFELSSFEKLFDIFSKANFYLKNGYYENGKNLFLISIVKVLSFGGSTFRIPKDKLQAIQKTLDEKPTVSQIQLVKNDLLRQADDQINIPAEKQDVSSLNGDHSKENHDQKKELYMKILHLTKTNDKDIHDLIINKKILLNILSMEILDDNAIPAKYLRNLLLILRGALSSKWKIKYIPEIGSYSHDDIENIVDIKALKNVCDTTQDSSVKTFQEKQHALLGRHSEQFAILADITNNSKTVHIVKDEFLQSDIFKKLSERFGVKPENVKVTK